MGDRGDTSMIDEVENFIVDNEVDGSAADALRDCAPAVQRQVIDRGGLSGARNPSSVLLARIRDASTPADFGDHQDGVGYVRMRGIPFSATPDDLLEFFAGLSPMSDGVIIGTTKEGRMSGEAFVPFSNISLAKEAIEQRNRAMMGDRYIELFPSTLAEAQRSMHGEPRQDRGDHHDRSQQYWDAQQGKNRTATEDEIDQFLAGHNIDPNVVDQLRDLSPNLQAAIIDRGGLQNARNPTSVLASRIRDAQSAPPMPPPPPSGGGGGRPRPSSSSLADRVERFLDESRVDDQAAESFRNCHPDVQEEVMQRGVSSARNPSSALVGRIRDVENAILSGRGGGGGEPPRPPPPQAPHSRGGGLAGAVEDFIRANGIDDRAADTLRGCNSRVQEIVIDRGDLHGTRNPSSALLSRIRDANASGHGGGGGGGGNGYSERDRHGGDFRGHHQDERGGRGGGRDGRGHSLRDAVEDFLRANYVDDRAMDALRSAAPDVQEAVLARGDLTGTRNPSSALLARLKDSERAAPPPPGRSGGPPAQPPTLTGPITLPGGLVDDLEFLMRIYADRDERAADALGRLQHVKYGSMQYAYGGGGPPPGPPPPENYYYDQPHPSHNNSQRGSRQHSERDRLEDQIEDFCRASGIDSRAAETLRRADPRVALTVIDKGVSGARNPSSALLARLREAEASMGAEPARARDRDPGHDRKRSRHADDVEAFIRSSGIDESAGEAFRRCSQEVQEAVMEKGVGGARNPSSALLARIRDLNGRGGGAGGDRRGEYPSSAPPRGEYPTSAPSRRGGDRYAPY